MLALSYLKQYLPNHMSKIGTLLTGAGVTTSLNALSQCPSCIMLGTVATANPLTGLVVEIGGNALFNITGQAALLSAIGKFCTRWVSTLQGVVFPIATGLIKRTTNIRLTNGGATVPDIFGWSEMPAGAPVLAGTTTINLSSFEDFSRFSALFIGTPANIGSAEITFMNGHKDTFSQVELDALFAMKHDTEAAGQLLGITVIDNTDQSILSVRLNIITAATTVAILKVPDEVFQQLQEIAA